MFIVFLLFVSSVARESLELEPLQENAIMENFTTHENGVSSVARESLEVESSDRRVKCNMHITCEYIPMAIAKISSSSSHYVRSSLFQKTYQQYKVSLSRKIGYKKVSAASKNAFEMTRETEFNTTNEYWSNSTKEIVYVDGTWQIFRRLTTTVTVGSESVKKTQTDFVESITETANVSQTVLNKWASDYMLTNMGTSENPFSSDYYLQFGTDCYGPDEYYSSNVSDISSSNNVNFPEDCQGLCQQSLGCKYFSWSNDGVCWLKRSNDGLVTKTGFYTGPKDCNYEMDIDFSGNDIQSFATNSPEECQNRCQLLPKCNVFTWVVYNTGYCYLKTSDAGYTYSPGYISGQKDSCYSSNVDYYHNDVDGDTGGTAMATPEECQSKCQGVEKCDFFTWANEGYEIPSIGGKCWLKTSDAGRVSKAGHFSGPKNCVFN